LTTTVVPVLGMTCRSCEARIERHVSKLSNVRRVSASAARGRVVIESVGAIPARAVAAAIGAAGYEIGRSPWLERDRYVWLEVGLSLVIVASVAYLAQVTGLTDIASGAGDLASGGLVVALVLGLAAGISTCMALVGGLVMALSASFQANGATSGLAGMRPTLVFLAGRIGGYGLLGGVLGAIGAGVTMPASVTAILMIVVAIVMTLLGARLTGVSPRIAGWTPTLPMGLGRSLGLGGAEGAAYSDRRAIGLGAATFFLPCGFTQAIQVYALSTGSPLFAGALMAAFAIGTAPGLLAVAGLPAIVPSQSRPTVLRFIGVAVLGFALLNGTAGLTLAGVPLPSFGIGATAAAALPAGVGPDGVQSLATVQRASGYEPREAAIYANVPTRWTIESRSSSSCAQFLVVPSLGISVRLRPGPNTIELPPMAAGRLNYSCAMGMFSGWITIVNAPPPSPSPAASVSTAPGGG
jgi:sulfite exporter TauE/SafE/copper chaperone CopZ